MKIRLENVSKKFGKVEALKDVSFSVSRGEFIFLTGPSGAGKTTIFRIMLGHTVPDEGTVQMGNITVFDGKKHLRRREAMELRRRVGVIFQDFQLVEDYTLEENIALALDIIGLHKKDKESRIAEVLDQVGLADRQHDFPRQLSGGELQRVCLARALSLRPEVILADEPTGNLDPQTSWHLVNLLKKINKENKTTIIMATHNFDIVNSMNLRVIRLEDGRVIADKKKGKYE